MPRRLTAEGVRAILAERTDEVFLLTLRISGEGFAPLHVVNNLESVFVDGAEYLPFPFTIVLPNESKDQPPEAAIRINNLSQEIIEKIRTVKGRPTFEIAVRLASDPSVAEVGPITLDSSTANWDDDWIQLSLGSKNLLNEPYPYRTMTPVKFPGLFQ